MSTRLRLLEVAKCAEDLIGDLGFAALPINPVQIALRKEIEVQSWEPTKPGVSGFLMKQGDCFGIGYSKFIANQGFINFTIGHELGHYFIPGHVEKLFASGSSVHQSHSGFVSHDACEREADFFSASLLMPESPFRKALRQSGSGFPAIESLASLCATSITATAIRFAEFAEDPVAIIVGNDGRVGFCCMSEAIRTRRGLTWLKAGDPIPSECTTARFQKNPANITAASKSEGFSMLDDWFDGAPRIEMKEDVVGLGHYGKTLTVLFTAESLDDEEDPNGEEEEGYLPSWRRGRGI